MSIDDLNEHEIGMLIVALKYWRAHRRDTSTRRTDPVLTDETVNLLLARLQRDSPQSDPAKRRRLLRSVPPPNQPHRTLRTTRSPEA